MGAVSKIAWTHATFNCRWGCHKVSPACKNCYAESFAKRTGNRVWGADAPRRFFGDKHWAEPLKWNRDAAKAGERRRVFCGSMMDIFELHPSPMESGMQLVARSRLWQLIDSTPWLDWLLLTKRPENAESVLPLEWWRNGLPSNVWMGTTVENQEYADLRIPHLLKIPARVRFLSCEPLLGPIDLDAGELGCVGHIAETFGNPLIHWIIAGGESGAGHREHQLEWSRSLRDQCGDAGVAYFFKQMGERASEDAFFQTPGGAVVPGRKRLTLAPRSKGEDLLEIPADLRIREFPTVAA